VAKCDRPWTRAEEQRAVALRAARHTIASIARELGRTYGAVSVRLSKLGATRARPGRRRPGDFLTAVAGACRCGARTDRRVAELLGSTHQEVFRARKKLGIPAASAAVVRRAVRAGGGKRTRKAGLVCWGCDRRQRDSVAGWAVARFGRTPELEAYCPVCVGVYGLPPGFGERPPPNVAQRPWTPGDDARLLAAAAGKTAAEMRVVVPALAEVMGRTAHSLNSRLYRLRTGYRG